jgi:hypothetical protein
MHVPCAMCHVGVGVLIAAGTVLPKAKTSNTVVAVAVGVAIPVSVVIIVVVGALLWRTRRPLHRSTPDPAFGMVRAVLYAVVLCRGVLYSSDSPAWGSLH